MTAASPRTPGLAAGLSMMMSRPASIRSGGFIAAAYTATNPSIADRNSAGPSSARVTFIAVSLRRFRACRRGEPRPASGPETHHPERTLPTLTVTRAAPRVRCLAVTVTMPVSPGSDLRYVRTLECQTPVLSSNVSSNGLDMATNLCSNEVVANSGRRDPWRPAAGRAGRGEALRPARDPAVAVRSGTKVEG